MDLRATIPCVTYESTSDLIITGMSKNAFDLIGIQPQKIAGKSLWEERIVSESRSLIFAKLDQIQLGEVTSIVHKIVNDNGLDVWVAHSICKDKSSVLGLMIPLGNSLGRVALDPSIVAQFAHKIGNHFQLINLMIGSLKRTGSSIDDVEALQQTADRIVELIRSFSQYAQAPAYEITFDLHEVLRSAVSTVEPLCMEKNLSINEVVQKSFTDTKIVGDPSLMEIAFGAVLQNAIEATTGGGEIFLKARHRPRGETRRAIAQITIADTGIGIESNMLTKAADPFVTSKRDHDGLGLSTALRVIENHGGTLTLSRKRDQGTQVEIVLPVAETPGSVQR